MKLEEARKHKNLFRSSLNNIKRKDINQMSKKVYYKILKCFRKHENYYYFNNYSTIASEAKYKTIHEKGHSSDLTRISKY